MKRWTKRVTIGIVSFLLAAVVAGAQQAAPTKPVVPLKIEVVINEYAGTKAVTRLPYTLSVPANENGKPDTMLRMGASVPIVTGSFGIPTSGATKPSNFGLLANTQFSYRNVGTDIDCSARSLDDGAFAVSLQVEWTFISPRPPSGSDVLVAKASVTNAFSEHLTLILRDGQTVQSTMATDPVSGHVIKVDVTLHVMKE